jgi:hypothetical protein
MNELDLVLHKPVKNAHCRSNSPHRLNKAWTIKEKIRSSVVSSVRYLLPIFQSSVFNNSKKFYRQKYQDALIMLLANLWFAEQHTLDIIISLSNTGALTDKKNNPKKITNTILKPLIYFLHDRDLLTLYKAPACDSSHISSWCKPSIAFKTLIQQQEGEVAYFASTQSIVLKDVKDKNGDAPVIEWKGSGALKSRVGVRSSLIAKGKAFEKIIKPINRLLGSATITINHGKKVPIHLYRVFNNKSFELGGRFYAAGGYQRMSGAKRKDLKINGQDTVELDYKAIHIHIAYQQHQAQLITDPYTITTLEQRDLWKTLFLRLININCVPSFKAQITRSGTDSVQKKVLEYRKQKAEFKNGTRSKPPKQDSILSRNFIDGIPVGMTGKEALDKILEAHPLIKSIISEDSNGLKFQYQDSCVMEMLLVNLTKKGIVALPVHDSVIVASHYEQVVMNEMIQVYSTLFPGYCIDVKKS